MLIANPIYDTVFKCLMENLEVAKGIISTIIDEDIVHLDFKAKENVHFKEECVLTLYYLDFIARIKQKDGVYKDVLIELQKTDRPYDIQRFRNYLGEQYRKGDEVLNKNGLSSRATLPLITIYFLGFLISPTMPAVIKVNRQLIDLLAGKEIVERNDFIECLTHDCYVIQIPALKLEMKSRLEYVLSVFKQENFINNDRHLKDYRYETNDQLMKAILNQLTRAAGNKELIAQLDLEELEERYIENALGEIERKLIQKDQALEEKDKTIVEKDKTIAEKEKALAEKEKIIEELLVKLANK